MPTVQIKAQLTTRQLLKAVAQMPQEDLDRFAEQVAVLRANQRAPRLSPAESGLLERINQGLAAREQERFDELVAKREIEDLGEDENAEYLRLTTLIEALNVERIKALVELARARRSTRHERVEIIGRSRGARARAPLDPPRRDAGSGNHDSGQCLTPAPAPS